MTAEQFEDKDISPKEGEQVFEVQDGGEKIELKEVGKEIHPRITRFAQLFAHDQADVILQALKGPEPNLSGILGEYLSHLKEQNFYTFIDRRANTPVQNRKEKREMMEDFEKELIKALWSEMEKNWSEMGKKLMNSEKEPLKAKMESNVRDYFSENALK